MKMRVTPLDKEIHTYLEIRSFIILYAISRHWESTSLGSTACQSGGPLSSIGQSIWGLWWRKWHWDRGKRKMILHTINRRNANWIGCILRWNDHIKTTIEEIIGRREVMRSRGRRRKEIVDDRKGTRECWKLEKRSTRSHCVEKSFRKGIWTCRKTD
jgi:hypothetical protein